MQTGWAQFLLLVITISPAVAQEAAAPALPQFPVRMDVAAGKWGADGEQRIVVTLTIQPAHSVFANPTGNEGWAGYEPVLTVTAGNHSREAEITYPVGELREDQLVGNYRVYTGTVSFTALVKRPKGDLKPLQVTVRVRPFNANGCLWPTKSLTKIMP
jgi:hypothetical protein